MMLRKKLDSLNENESLEADAYWNLGKQACDELDKRIADEKIATTPEDRAAYEKAINHFRQQLEIGEKSDNPKLCKHGLLDKKKFKKKSDELLKKDYPETGFTEIKGILTLLFVEEIHSPFLKMSRNYSPYTKSMFTLTVSAISLFGKSMLEDNIKKLEKLDGLTQAYRSNHPEVSELADSYVSKKEAAANVM